MTVLDSPPVPGWARTSCIACGERVVARRHPWMIIGGTRSASWLIVWPTGPQQLALTDPLPPVDQPLFVIGVVHEWCAVLARERLEAGEIVPAPDLPRLTLDEVEAPPLPTLHGPSDAGSCPFCGATNNITDEHIWPAWLSRALREMGASFIDRESGHPRRTTSLDLVAPVCGDCNNNWMSVLENDVKHVLVPMVRAERSELSSPDQRLLATWALKTTCLLDFVQRARSVVPRGFAHELAIVRRPPPSAAVWVSGYKDDVNAIGAWLVPYRFPDRHGQRPDDPNALAVTFTVFRVVFQVLIHFSAGAGILRDNRVGFEQALVRVWPPSSQVVWPPRYVFGQSSLQQLVASIEDGI